MKARDIGGLGSQPQVNLLPPEIRSARGLRVVQRMLGLAMLAVLALVGLGYLYAANQVSRAESDLDEAQAETTRLLAEKAQYMPVTAVLDQLTATDVARRLVMASEIYVGPYLGAITAVTPAGVTLDTVTYTGASPTVLAPTPANTLVQPGVGEIDIIGRAPMPVDTIAWARALNTIPGLRNAWVEATTVGGTDSVSYQVINVSVTVDISALANRFGEYTPLDAPAPDDATDATDEDGDA